MIPQTVPRATKGNQLIEGVRKLFAGQLRNILGGKTMDVVNLPVLSIDAPLVDTLAVMKGKKCSAVVARDNDGCWLFKAGWVVVGIARGESVLADLERKWKVHETSASHAAQEGIDLTEPHLTQPAVEQFLDRVGSFYMLATPVPKVGQIVKIITRHESLAAEVSSGPSNYYCTNPNLPDDPHPYLPPPLPADLLCTQDGSPIRPTG